MHLNCVNLTERLLCRRFKLDEFQQTSSAIDEFDLCIPEFTVGNCLDAIPISKRYDRIYCGAAASNEYVAVLVDMLKVREIYFIYRFFHYIVVNCIEMN